MNTSNFINSSEIPDTLKGLIIRKALNQFMNNQKIDFLIFEGKGDKVLIEDEGRSMRIPIPYLSVKCYAKLDDYGEPSERVERYGKEVAEELDSINTRYVATIMLAEDY